MIPQCLYILAPICKVTGIPTEKVQASIGSKIWSDRNYQISKISDGLEGATLFKPKHYVHSTTMSIIATENDVQVFVALYEEGNREGGLMQELGANGWELTSEFLEWSNQYRLNKVWKKNIAAGTTISFKSTKNSMTFAILASEGMI